MIYPDCEICDVCGPLDVFHFANFSLPRFGRTDEPGYQLVILAATPGPVRTHCGIEIIATQSWYDIKDGLDTLVVSGGINAEQACKDNPALVEWVRAMAPRARRVTSICTGAFILAAAGLLNHRRATTHWMFSDVLATTYPLIQVDSSLIFARDGHIYTSGGITAGIDLALALVEEDLGQEIALAVARTLVVFPRRPGGQSQFTACLVAEASSQPDIRVLQAWIMEHPGDDLSVEALADRMAMSPRNFARLFHSETGETPAPNGRGPTPPAASSNKPSCRSRQSPSNAASAIANACDAPFNAFSTSVRTTIGPGFDRPCSPDRGVTPHPIS